MKIWSFSKFCAWHYRIVLELYKTYVCPSVSMNDAIHHNNKLQENYQACWLENFSSLFWFPQNERDWTGRRTGQTRDGLVNQEGHVDVWIRDFAGRRRNGITSVELETEQPACSRLNSRRGRFLLFEVQLSKGLVPNARMFLTLPDLCRVQKHWCTGLVRVLDRNMF